VLPISIPDEKLVYAYIVQIALVVIPVLYTRVTHHDLRNYGLKITGKLLLQGVGLSIIIGICLSLITTPVTLTVGFVLLSCLLVPVCEEFFFRGFLQTHLMEKVKGGKRFLKLYFSYGLMLTALIFGAFHLLDVFLVDVTFAGVVINALIAIFFGFLMGYIYQETHSILTPVIMHSCLNGLSLLPL
jgi:membrane protease YdiL (CAAX protease family)